jgi:hypothetical protein
VSRLNRALVLFGVSIVAAGCATQSLPRSASTSANDRRVSQAPEAFGPSNAGVKGLLYVSDAQAVDVYTYPQGKLAMKLTGMEQPVGECVDSAGDVFVVASANGSFTSSTIYEYAHGSTTPLATLNDPGAGYSCSSDPVTGDLAVANESDQNNPYNPRYGDVAVYAQATGNPTMYHSSAFIAFTACGYDNASNLYALATTSSSPHQTALARLASGSEAFQSLSVDAKISGGYRFVPSVQWDGKHMTVSSDSAQGHQKLPILIYRLNVSGSDATVIGTTQLNSPRNLHGGQSWILGGKLFGTYYYKGEKYLAFWKYPKGGEAQPIARKIGSGNDPAVGLTFSRSSK